MQLKPIGKAQHGALTGVTKRKISFLKKFSKSLQLSKKYSKYITINSDIKSIFKKINKLLNQY